MQKIACPKCEGEGEIELPERLAEIMSAFRTSTTSEKLFEKFPYVSRNAHVNRLEKLRSLGLLKRTRNGKEFIYTKA